MCRQPAAAVPLRVPPGDDSLAASTDCLKPPAQRRRPVATGPNRGPVSSGPRAFGVRVVRRAWTIDGRFFRHDLSRMCLSGNSPSAGPPEQNDSFQRRPNCRDCLKIRQRAAPEPRLSGLDIWTSSGQEKARLGALEQSATGGTGRAWVWAGATTATIGFFLAKTCRTCQILLELFLVLAVHAIRTFVSTGRTFLTAPSCRRPRTAGRR